MTNWTGANFTVPATNSAVNTNVAEVVGSKLDTNLGDSLYARLDELHDQFQEQRKCYPTLAAGATVVSSASAWTYGSYAAVVPASTIGNPYHVLALIIETCSITDGVFQVGLYQGAGDTLISEMRFSIAGGFFGNQVYVVGSAECVADAQVRARVACSAGAATLTVSLVYLEHT
jgi:hypothetical protein